MSLRAKVLTYLLALHVALGSLAFVALRPYPAWLLAFELAFGVSAVIGYRLVRAFFVPLDLIRTGTELIREREFATYFRQVGQPEMDQLVQIYNRMVDQLREERLKLEEQNLFLERVLDASPAGVITLDPTGRLQQANPAALKLLPQKRNDWCGLTPERLPAPLGPQMAALGDGGSAVVLLAGQRRLRLQRASFYDRGFRRAFFLLEELTDELRATERGAYDKLIRMMSHEVRNSVGVVRSLLDSCRHYETRLDEGDRVEYSRAIEVAVTRLLHLNAFMDGLAQVVRIPPPERRPCDVAQLLGDVARLMRPELERRDIALVWEAEAESPEVQLDKNQIEQVLVNVLRNAIEAIGQNGRIEIRLARRGQGPPELVVRDSGSGLTEEAEMHVFSPFYTTKRDGQGIGLTLSREILTQHGFDFSLTNATGGGAEFRIVFCD